MFHYPIALNWTITQIVKPKEQPPPLSHEFFFNPSQKCFSQQHRKNLGFWAGIALTLSFVTGDTHIDSPYIGVAVIGKVLVDAGYKVGIIAQPNTTSNDDISRPGMMRDDKNLLLLRKIKGVPQNITS